MEIVNARPIADDAESYLEHDAAERSAAAAARPAARPSKRSDARPAARPSKRSDDRDDDDDRGREIDRARVYMIAVNAARDAIAEIPNLHEGAPAVSEAVDRDNAPLLPTEDGYAALIKSAKKRRDDADAQRISLQQALLKYSVLLNAACEWEYKKLRYREELRQVQKVRNDAVVRKVDRAAAEYDVKTRFVRGFAEREAEKKNYKKRKLGTDETKKPSIFDLM